MVFRMQWPADVATSIMSDDNPTGSITNSNSDLEMAGLLMLWLVMEEVCNVQDSHMALFSDNLPTTVHWVQCMAAKHSEVASNWYKLLHYGCS